MWLFVYLTLFENVVYYFFRQLYKFSLYDLLQCYIKLLYIISGAPLHQVIFDNSVRGNLKVPKKPNSESKMDIHFLVISLQ